MNTKSFKPGWEDDSEWKAKRLTFLATGAEKKDVVAEEVQQTPVAEARIAAHRGKTPEQAFKAIDGMLDHNSDEMQKVFNQWNEGLLGKAGNAINKLSFGRVENKAVKSKLREHLHDVAKKKVEMVAKNHDLSDKEAALHAKNSIAMHTEVVRSAAQMQESLQEAIDAESELLKSAKGGLKLLKDFKIFGEPVNRSIKKFQHMKDLVGEISLESAKKIDDKGEKVQRIQSLEEGIMKYVHKKSPDSAISVGTELKRWIISGKEDEKQAFFSALERAGITAGSEARSTINRMARRLFEGEVSKPGLRSYMGSFTKDDVRQYFLTKAVEEGVVDTNVDGESTTDRVDRMNQHALGQRVKIAGSEYYLIKKEKQYKGFLLKSATEQDVYGYITNEGGTPIFSRENADKTFAAPIGLSSTKTPTDADAQREFSKSINFDEAPLAISKAVNAAAKDEESASEEETNFVDTAEEAIAGALKASNS